MRFFTQPNRLWSHWLILAATASLAVFVWEAASDEPPAAAPQPAVPVATVDVAKIFKEFREFNAKIDRIKAEIETFEAGVREDQRKLLRLTEEGHPEQDIENFKAYLTKKVGEQKQSFLDDEARVYFDAYNRIEEETKRLAAERSIDVVLRHNSDKMNPADRASVLQGVNRDVIHSTAPDLTADVLAALNK